MQNKIFIAALLVFNAIPIYGVLNWGWQAFDLIFLYWLENVIIGVFALVRFLVRPYRYITDFIAPVFFAPFFAIHYGLFCAVHGVFVFKLFGDGSETEGIQIEGLLTQILSMLQDSHLLMAIGALFAFQVFDWIRDVVKRGLGSDGIRDMMTSPYRRIVVLHITLIASGFALAAMGEPVIGLIILVVLKTLFDLYHWYKDEHKVASVDPRKSTSLPVAMLKEMRERFPEPELYLNGRSFQYDSFEELVQAKPYKAMLSNMRLMKGSHEANIVEAYMNIKVAEESRSELTNERGH